MQMNQPFLLHDGQIVYAKALRFFPNNLAEVQIGTHKLVARLEIPLESGKGYWFQAAFQNGELHLQLLSHHPLSSLSPAGGDGKRPWEQKSPDEILALFKKNPLPLTKEQLRHALLWLKSADDRELAMEVIRLMSGRNMPFADPVFHSLYEAGNSLSLTDLISSLKDALLLEENPGPIAKQILRMIEEMMAKPDTHPAQSSANGKALFQQVIKAVHQTGIFSGHPEAGPNAEPALKPLLITYAGLEGAGKAARRLAEQIILKMDGYQLLSSGHGSMQQIVFSVPLAVFQQQTELTMQWTARRMPDGKIDADYCRILFYLNLPHLKETVVDMQIQNRVATVNIFNASSRLNSLAEELLPILKAQLGKWDYHLSAVHFRQPAKAGVPETKPLSVFGHHYTGVDIRI
jgi:hypothetical protein